jgi:hypothetical protein
MPNIIDVMDSPSGMTHDPWKLHRFGHRKKQRCPNFGFLLYITRDGIFHGRRKAVMLAVRIFSDPSGENKDMCNAFAAILINFFTGVNGLSSGWRDRRRNISIDVEYIRWR